MEISKLIKHHAEQRKRMEEGEAYYKTHNTRIYNRVKEFYSLVQGRNITDFTKANHKLASGFYKLIVKQKVNYSINNNLSIQPAELSDFINIQSFTKTLKKMGTEATNKIYAVLYWYVENGELKYKNLPSEQCIPVYNSNNNEKLDMLIRYYEDNKQEYADVYTVQGITVFKKDENHEFIQQGDTQPYLVKRTTANNQTIRAENVNQWGEVPVVILYNNDTKQTDLEMCKTYIDMYDIAISDYGNNFDDFGEMYWILKGYDGQDARSFVEEFKKSRIVKVGENGDASQVAQEIPYMARDSFIAHLKQDIYRFAMAVDPEGITKDTTNLTIKALFSNLDLKANDFEENIQEMLEKSLYFINKYAEMNNMQQLEYIEASFKRATLFNKGEIIDNVLKQRGMRADEVLLAELPDVNDVEYELEKLNEQSAINPIGLGGGNE